MKIYLVGGAVRDQLLGLPVLERDWVVVGSTPQQMIDKGYQPVGKDFPVFLHPQTKEEYALARTERKIAAGYHGFVFYTSPEITLEDDLMRRDLTVNAIAQDESGQLIDPWHGQEDIQNGVLRHVSDAFSEDPVRVLRIARFASRFAKFGFKVAHETYHLMRKMVSVGEVDALVAERVWQEFYKALGHDDPVMFFKVLFRCGALERIMPEVHHVLSSENHEADFVEIKSMRALYRSCQLTDNRIVRFSALMFYLNVCPVNTDIKENHQILIDQFCMRLKVPNDYRNLAKLVARFYYSVASLAYYGKAYLDVLEGLDVFRRIERLSLFVMACEAIMMQKEKPIALKNLENAYAVASQIDIQNLIQTQHLKGAEIGKAIYKARLKKIEGMLVDAECV